MIKRYHPVALSVIRGSLVKAGFHVKRIRTLIWPQENADWCEVEVEFIHQTAVESDNWCPADMYAWVIGCFTAEIDSVAIEYRSGKWYAKLICLGGDALAEKIGQLPLPGAALGDASGSASVGVTLILPVDENDIPF